MPSVWQTRIFASAGTWLCSVPRSRSEQMISLETLRRSEDISLDFTQDQSRSVNDQLVHTTCSFRSQSWRNGSPGTAILLMQQWPLIQTALTSCPTGNINEKISTPYVCMYCRKKFPKLEQKNIQFWFKNRRAKCKRINNNI